MTMDVTVYLLCALTSCLCAALLYRQNRRSASGLLRWSALAFLGLAANNILLFVDLVLVPQVSFLIVRNVVGALSMGILVFGFLWSAR